jgi:starch phosphorylase
MYQALEKNNDKELTDKKREAKKILFEVVADQCGEIYDENILTLVFAKRFAGYKRPDLFFHDMEKFTRLVTNNQMPVQIIWAGKPYPMDYAAIGTFDKIVDICKTYTNCSILVGYECRLSKLLKQGADVWLNVPRLTHEASGTSGITAAMNGAVNVSLPDGWFPEFARDKINSFVIPPCDISLPDHQQDDVDADSLYQLLETEILPMYYQHPEKWTEIIKNGMRDIIPRFDSNRMAKEYYEELYI